MLLIKIALLTLSALPTSLAKRHHHSASTFSTLTSASNTTIPITTMSATTAAGAGKTDCPTVTKTVSKTEGICPLVFCRPIGPLETLTSTFQMGCGCPAATPTSTFSRCLDGCEVSTDWVYKTAGGC